jgi:hypothetical protein
MRTQGPHIKAEEREIAVTGAYGEHASVRRPRLISKGRDRRERVTRKGQEQESDKSRGGEGEY